MQINRLSVAAVNAKTKPGLYADGMGLYLRFPPAAPGWIFRYMLAGRPRKMGLGSVNTVTLKLARERAGEARLKLLDADDPIEQRKAERLEKLAASATVLTFKESAEAYIKAHRSGWKNIKHAAQWKATLEAYAYPQFGSFAVSRVDTALVLKALEAIWTTKPETATRVRGRIEHSRLGDGARLPPGREPGPVAGPSRQVAAGPQQGCQGEASRRAALSRDRRVREHIAADGRRQPQGA